MLNLSKSGNLALVEKFNNTFRYIDDILSMDNPVFTDNIQLIYPSELQLNKSDTSDLEASFLDLQLKVNTGKININVYDKRDDFNFKIVNYPFLDGDIPISPSYGVFISQLVRFARICSSVNDFRARSKLMTTKLLNQGFRYHKLRKTFNKHYSLITKYNYSLKSLIIPDN